MKIGYNGGGHQKKLGDIVDAAVRAEAMGCASIWLSQIVGPDSLTALAVAATKTSRIELGTSIVPIYGRHPMALAQQALTAQAASGGRLTLGIGPSHKPMVEGALGESYDKPFTRTRETLLCLNALLRGGTANFQGEELTCRGALSIDTPAPEVLIAALGPKMLELAGSEADGTALWMVGPKTINSHIAPLINRAASKGGKKAPRILAGLTICVTNKPNEARARAAEAFKIYGRLPAYQRMLEREGVSGPEGLLVAGDESTVEAGVQAYAEAGATEARIGVLPGGKPEMDAGYALLASLCR